MLAEIASSGAGGVADGKKDTPAALAARGLFPALAKALEDDLGLYRFWSELFAFCRAINTQAASRSLSAADASLCLAALGDVDGVLGLLDENALPVPRTRWPEAVAALVASRERARRDKDFLLADRLRDDIAGAGFRLDDTPSGTRLFPASGQGS